MARDLAIVFTCIGAGALIACIAMIVGSRRSADATNRGTVIPALVIMFTIAALFLAIGILSLLHRSLIPTDLIPH